MSDTAKPASPSVADAITVATELTRSVHRWSRAVVIRVCQPIKASTADERARLAADAAGQLARDLSRCEAAQSSVRDRLHRVNTEPVRFGGECYPSAHEVAWHIGSRVWSACTIAARIAWEYDLSTEVLERLAAGTISPPEASGLYKPLAAFLRSDSESHLSLSWPSYKLPRDHLLSWSDYQHLDSQIRQESARMRTADEGPGTKSPARRPRRRKLSVNLKRRTITLDDTTYDVSSEQALRWVKVLSDHNGEWISGRELVHYDSRLTGVKTDRLKCYLPDPIKALIESEPAKGSRLRLS